MSLRVERHTLEEATDSLAAYLPGGPLWAGARSKPALDTAIPGYALPGYAVPGVDNTDRGTKLYALLAGLSGLLLYAENFNYLYSSEFIPSAGGYAFLENWERALGIPDDCFPGPALADKETRRLHVLVKLASLGVQTRADFERLAELLGFVGTTVQSGIDAGLPEPEGQFTIVVNLPFTLAGFPLVFPIPFGTDEFEFLECLFLKLKPDNCAMVFEYG